VDSNFLKQRTATGPTFGQKYVKLGSASDICLHLHLTNIFTGKHLITLYTSIISGNALRLSIGIITYLLRSCSFRSVQSVNTQFVNGSLFVFEMQNFVQITCKHHLILMSSPRNENWNLLVRFKFLNLFLHSSK